MTLNKTLTLKAIEKTFINQETKEQRKYLVYVATVNGYDIQFIVSQKEGTIAKQMVEKYFLA